MGDFHDHEHPIVVAILSKKDGQWLASDLLMTGYRTPGQSDQAV
jgi:hypothetical protein